MSIWVLAALLTLVCCVALFYAGRRGAVNGAQSEALKARVRVYEAQLGEIERDVVAGTISKLEAEGARAELGRELLRQSEGAHNVPPQSESADTGAASGFGLPAIAVGIFLTIGLGAAGYAVLGQPQMLDLRLVDRPDAAAALEVADAVAKVEERLARVPGDVRGWQVIAPIYLGQRRFDEAVNAFRQVVTLAGANADNETDLAEALGAAAGGVFSNDAVALLRSAARRDPAHIRSRFYLAAHATETGDYEAALNLWTSIIGLAPPDAPWLGTAIEGQTFAQAELALVAGGGGTAGGVGTPGSASIANGDAPAATAPGPNAAEIAAAAQLSEPQRSALATGMVERLDQRLHAQGGAPQEWARLVRSRAVLGQNELAIQDAASARVALTDVSERATFEAMVAQMIAEIETQDTGVAQ